MSVIVRFYHIGRLLQRALLVACTSLALLPLFTNSASAQTTGGDRLFFDAVSFAGPSTDSSRLDVFLAVPYSSIAFERKGVVFTSTYRVHVQVASGDRRLFDTAFDHVTETRSSEVAAAQVAAYDFFQKRLTLPPGTYDARVDVLDTRTSLLASARRSVSIGDFFAHPFALSGILLVERIREDSNGFVVTPRISDDIGTGGGEFFVFFEAYNRAAEIDVQFEALFRGANGGEISRQSTRRSIGSGTSQQWIRVDATGLKKGAYEFELRAAAGDDTTKVLATTRRQLKNASGGSGIPGDEAELDDRIAQLRYVGLQSDIDNIRDAATIAERRVRFSDFWTRHDPTPGTRENEAMLEYYARIDYTQEHFRSYLAGWLTDQGRVYIVYGPPDNVIRDPFNTDSRRREIWQYFSRGNLQIVFQDDSGFGDYRLVTPINQLEKYRYGH